ncbi:MAG: response regulator [Lachnospiraceae bacterium]|nr:response regulator [Lachnospiraceae bacterium]
MKIIAVDDEQLQLDALKQAIDEVIRNNKLCDLKSENGEIVTFDDAYDALDYSKENQVDIAFLDVQMPGMTGIELAYRLKETNADINIIFCTGYSQYAVEAMELRASGYITKPVGATDITREMENLRNPLKQNSDKRIRLQCFGNFEIFVDEKPLQFQLEKTKEVLAYLTDRKGATCSNAEITAVLWEDDSQHKSYFQKLRNDLKDTLQAVGCEKLINFSWGKLGLNTSMVECDYYDWVEGKPTGINAFHGEYMINYSWSEFLLGQFYEGGLKK